MVDAMAALRALGLTALLLLLASGAAGKAPHRRPRCPALLRPSP